MSRQHLDYSRRQPLALSSGAEGAVQVAAPEPGFFRYRLRSNGVRGGVKIWFGPPHDPVTGEELDRSWRWQALFDDQPVHFDDVWPACTGEPISEADYRRYCARRKWAEQHAPQSAYADPRKKHDLFSIDSPLPF